MKGLIKKSLMLGALLVSASALADKPTITESIQCGSPYGGQNRCYVGGKIVSAGIQVDYSRGLCSFGQTFAWADNYILVTNGCTAQILVTHQGGYFPQPQPPVVVYPPFPPRPRPPFPRPYPGLRSDDVKCESNSDRYDECNTDLNQIVSIEVLDQKSHAACIQGRSFGITGRRVWVDRGCRAKFRVYGY